MKPILKDVVLEHRKLSGLNQAELAKLAGVGKSAVFDVEHGKESIQFDTLLKILNALNISIHLESPLLNAANRSKHQEGSP